MWKINRLQLPSLCLGAVVLAGCSGSSDAAKAKADAEAAKAEVAAVKSELAQVKSELAQLRAAQDAGRVPAVRYQLIIDPKGGGYLFDPATGQVLHTDLKSGGWTVAADARR